MSCRAPDEEHASVYVLGTDHAERARLAGPWVETSRVTDDPTTLVENPDLELELTVGRSTVPIRATYEACFALVREVFIRDGSGGLGDLFRRNSMTSRFARGGGEGGGEIGPEASLSPELRLLYRLLSKARERVEVIAADRAKRIGEASKESAHCRLVIAHEQIQHEVVRYLDGPGLAQGTALDAHVPAGLFTLRNDDVVAGLIRGLTRCRELVVAMDGVARRLQDARGKAIGGAIRSASPLAFGSPISAAGAPSVAPNSLAAEYVNRIAESDPAVVQARAAFGEASSELEEQLMVSGLEYPVLFRIYRQSDLTQPAVALAVVEALRAAEAANQRLRSAVSEDPDFVWQFPPTVRETMMDLSIADVSIAWTAAEERLENEQGPRLAAQLGVVSGLAVGGSALLGAAVAPPIGVAIVLGDVLVNAVDALQEYLSYRRLKSGYDAVLDPSLALGAEPDLLGTVLTIAFDLAAAVPIPGHGAIKAASL